jgi:hypothetical protein
VFPIHRGYRRRDLGVSHRAAQEHFALGFEAIPRQSFMPPSTDAAERADDLINLLDRESHLAAVGVALVLAVSSSSIASRGVRSALMAAEYARVVSAGRAATLGPHGTAAGFPATSGSHHNQPADLRLPRVTVTT